MVTITRSVQGRCGTAAPLGILHNHVSRIDDRQLAGPELGLEKALLPRPLPQVPLAVEQDEDQVRARLSRIGGESIEQPGGDRLFPFDSRVRPQQPKPEEGQQIAPYRARVRPIVARLVLLNRYPLELQLSNRVRNKEWLLRRSDGEHGPVEIVVHEDSDQHRGSRDAADSLAEQEVDLVDPVTAHAEIDDIHAVEAMVQVFRQMKLIVGYAIHERVAVEEDLGPG